MAVVMLLVGCGAPNSARSPGNVTVTVTQTVGGAVKRSSTVTTHPKRPPSIAEPASLKTFTGSYFSVDYSGSWYVEAAEADKGSYLDTTIRSRANPQVMLRVDVAPGDAKDDLVSSARQLERQLRSQPEYHRLDFRRITFEGRTALRWEFEVSERGSLLRKVDIFFGTEAGDGFAILTQAPATTYALWRRLFERLRKSLQVSQASAGAVTSGAVPSGAVGGADASPPTPAAFCETHACIPSFDNGSGSIVQCADGMWSHSGGRPGACSYHGGVASGSSSDSGGYDSGFDAGSGYTEDYGSGNGYTVICADGTISDSGGIQGACSHHGGVGR